MLKLTVLLNGLLLNELILLGTCWYPDDIWAIVSYLNSFLRELERDYIQ